MVVYSMEANTGKSYFKLLKLFSQIMTRSAIVPRLPCACARKYICKFCSWKFNVKYTHGEFACPPLRLGRLGNFCCRKYSCTKTITAGENVFSQNTCEHKTCTKYFYSRKTWLFFFFFSSFTTKIKCLCFVLVFFTVRHLRAIFFPCTPKSRNDGCGVTCEHHFYELRLSRALICFHAIVVFFFSFFFFFWHNCALWWAWVLPVVSLSVIGTEGVEGWRRRQLIG